MVRIAFALLLCLLLLPSPALAEKRVALVIGIDKYDNLVEGRAAQEGAERCSGSRAGC